MPRFSTWNFLVDEILSLDISLFLTGGAGVTSTPARREATTGRKKTAVAKPSLA